jgi:hypothetical protein
MKIGRGRGGGGDGDDTDAHPPRKLERGDTARAPTAELQGESSERRRTAPGIDIRTSIIDVIHDVIVGGRASGPQRQVPRPSFI